MESPPYSVLHTNEPNDLIIKKDAGAGVFGHVNPGCVAHLTFSLLVNRVSPMSHEKCGMLSSQHDDSGSNYLLSLIRRTEGTSRK